MSIFDVTKVFVLNEPYESRLDLTHHQSLSLPFNAKANVKDINISPTKDYIGKEEKVKMIEQKAYELGWLKEQLWYIPENKYHFAKKGLICCIQDNIQIGEVTQQYIELIIKEATRTIRQRFYNQLVEQPWLKFCPRTDTNV